jgi:type II secretory pathway pseudopilin PulG
MLELRQGATLVELLLAMLVISIVGGMGVATSRHAADTRAVNSAANDAVAAFAAARRHAVATGGPTALRLDADRHQLIIHSGTDTIRRLIPMAAHGVSLSTTRDSMAYDAHGLGIGAANLTLILTRQSAAETLVVSRLGRVRR